MTSQTSFGSSMLFQSINDDLNASLATADELSKEFNTLLKEVAVDNNNTAAQARSTDYRSMPTSVTTREKSGSSGDSYSTIPSYHSPKSIRSIDSVKSGSKNQSSSPVFSTGSLPSPKMQRGSHHPLPGFGSDSYSYKLESPKHSPKIQRRNSPTSYDKNPQVSASYMERSVSPIPTAVPQPPRTAISSPTYSSSSLLSPYDNSQMGRRSPRPDMSQSPLSFNYSTPPRNHRQHDEHMQRQKAPSKWNETDLDMSYERKTQQPYDKTERLRHSVPNSGWRESNLDGPSQPSAKKESRFLSQQPYSSLPRNTRTSVPLDGSSQPYSAYYPQPIISRISIPPTSTQARRRRPIPLSVIMRLQNPHWIAMTTRYPSILEGEADMAAYQPAVPIPREYFFPPSTYPQQMHAEFRQAAVLSDVLNPTDVDAELEHIDLVHQLPVTDVNLPMPESTADQERQTTSRPLSPTRLQPVVAPEAQVQEIPNLEELLRIRAEIPRPLKRRGSMDQSLPLKKASQHQPNQYKNLINKLFHRREHRTKVEAGSDNSSSSEEEDSGPLVSALPPQTATTSPQDDKSYHSILRKSSREQKSSGKHAHLSPLVLALDGALVGELETVQRAMQEVCPSPYTNDPSQSNDEGITALHNAICGGHYHVVDFLVQIGANVSAPDSHGWTPLHCAASCNDRSLCEFLVRNGAAVMAVTESDSATASQKCDPYAVGFEECENFLKGVEEAMGVENSGVLYALWSYPAQAADELSFKEGDMVTILQKHEGSDWWWASLCGREGFVPNNYFGLFPKVRPKSLF